MTPFGADTVISSRLSGNTSSVIASGTCKPCLAPTGKWRMTLPSRSRLRQMSSFSRVAGAQVDDLRACVGRDLVAAAAASEIGVASPAPSKPNTPWMKMRLWGT